MRRAYLGWDVGAWHSDKGRSRDGLVLLSDGPDGPVPAGGPWRGNLRKAYDGAVGQELLDRLLRLVESDVTAWDEVTMAIDAPLGWPEAFETLLTGRRAPVAIPPRKAANPLLMRATEVWLGQRGHRPLSAVQDLIGSQSTKAISVLTALGVAQARPGVWSGRVGSVGMTAIETYPTPCRASPSLAASNARLVAALAGSSADVLDALTCALVAWTFVASPHQLAQPPRPVPAREGWIWVPEDCLAPAPGGHETTEEGVDEAAWFPGRRVLPGRLVVGGRVEAPGALPAGDGCVYAVATRATEPIPRVNGRTSRLLYVGKGYLNRPESLRSGRHSAHLALDRVRRALGRDQLDVELWVCSVANGGLHEVKVLNYCAHRYGELPPGNQRWEGTIAAAVVREMVAWAHEDAQQAGSGVYAWPDEAPTAVWVDVHDGPRGEWCFSVGWLYTTERLRGRDSDVPEDLRGKLVLVGEGRERNRLADIPSVRDWGRGELTLAEATALDGVGDPADLDAWLDTFTNTGWRAGASPYETLKRTLGAGSR